MRTATAILALSMMLMAAAPDGPPKIIESFNARVISVTDGDTIKVLKDKQQINVRLEGIDAPEKGQEFGSKATDALKAMLQDNPVVTIDSTGQDKYGRTLGYVTHSDSLINLKMVEQGFAWHFKKYNSEQRFADAETAARTAKRGLWAGDRPMAPWDFRSLPNIQPEATGYWLNTSSNVRHNATCKHFMNTSKGRSCSKAEGKPCGMCGG